MTAQFTSTPTGRGDSLNGRETNQMPRRFYLFTRDLHLYAGLFISPFVLLFAFSVFVLVHPSNRGPSPGAAGTASVKNLSVSPNLETLSCRPRVDAVRTLLDQAGVHGEIGFIRHFPDRKS